MIENNIEVPEKVKKSIIISILKDEAETFMLQHEHLAEEEMKAHGCVISNYCWNLAEQAEYALSLLDEIEENVDLADDIVETYLSFEETIEYNKRIELWKQRQKHFEENLIK